jgi:hypothetical protein
MLDVSLAMIEMVTMTVALNRLLEVSLACYSRRLIPCVHIYEGEAGDRLETRSTREFTSLVS